MKIQILVIFALSLIVFLGTISAATGDLNSDNKVDFSDAFIIIKWIINLDRTNSASDVNGDGVVNIFDIVQVGILLGKQYGNDTTAPIITAGKPNVNLSATATHAVLSVSTNERAICKHSTSSGTNFSSMTQFNKTGGIFHATNLTGLSNGNAYNYYIKCQDETGNLNSSDYLISFNVGSVAADTQAPTQPTNLQASALSQTLISLTWTASTDNVAVTGYRVFRCTGSGCTPSSLVGSPSANSYSDSGLSSNTTYTYRVAAFDAAGNQGTNSSSANATTLVPGAQVCEATGAGKCYYISLTGSDTNNGSFDYPYRYPNKTTGTNGNGAAGDYVYIRGGVYTYPTGFNYDRQLNGAAGERITVKEYPGEQVILDGQNGIGTLITIGGQGAIFDGFELRNLLDNVVLNGGSNGINGGGKYVTVRNMIIHDIGGDASNSCDAGIRTSAGEYWEIYNNTLYRIRDTTGSGHQGNVNSICFLNGGYHKIYNNNITGYEDGACLYSKHGNAYPIEIYNNTFTDCLSGDSRAFPFGGLHVYLHNNLFIRTGTSFFGQQTDVGGGIPAWNARIEYNTFVDAVGIGGQWIHPQAAVRNNIIYEPTTSNAEMWRLAEYIADAGYNSGKEEFSSDYNCYYSPGTVRFSMAYSSSGGAAGPAGCSSCTLATWRTETTGDYNSFQADPLFVDFNGGNYHLQGGSPCADMGAYAGPYADGSSSGVTTDVTAPALSNLQPSGTLSSGTTQTIMSLTTNEPAICRWNTVTPVFDDSAGLGAPSSGGAKGTLFNITGNTSHSILITGLSNGQSYTRYVACQDRAGKIGTSTISFSVA